MYTISRYIAEIHYIYLVYFVNCSHGEIFCFIFRFAKHISQSIFLPLILRLHSNSHLLTSLDFGPFWNVIWTWLRIICIFLRIFPFSCFPGMTIEIYILCNDVHCTHTHILGFCTYSFRLIVFMYTIVCVWALETYLNATEFKSMDSMIAEFSLQSHFDPILVME